LITGTTIVPHPRKERYPGEGRAMLKSAYGWATDAAIVATEATLEGFKGPGHALDDNMGFWEVKPSNNIGVESFSDQIGKKWSILDVAFKPYPACRFIHPVLQGIQTILQTNVLESEEIQKIEVHSFALLEDEHHSIYRPVSETDALFSVPFTVSAMIFGNGLSGESYSEDMLFDPEVLNLADRVKVYIDENFENAYPNRLGAKVIVNLTNGQSEEAIVENPKGAPSDPMTNDELENKFNELTSVLFGNAKAIEISSAIDHIEQYTSIDKFSRLLRFS
jgi:2-methylcitrate dehydratase PrpD